MANVIRETNPCAPPLITYGVSKSNEQHLKHGAYLMRLLPLMIASTIPEGNEYWELFLSLMDICEISFAPSVPCELFAYLEYLVHGFLVALKKLFPVR